VAYVLRDHANGDLWKNILVIYNGTGLSHDLNIAGNWSIVADADRAGSGTLRQVTDRIRVEPFSLIVAHTDGDFRFDLNPAGHP